MVLGGNMNNTEYTMNDETIAQIAKILQVAILTGTDIVDNLRLARFTVDGETLRVSETYADEFNANLENMLAAAQVNQALVEETPENLTTGVFE